MKKFGSELRRYISEDVEAKGRPALVEVLKNVALTDEELHSKVDPDKLRQKLTNAADLDIMELYESLIGTVRTTAFSESDWHTTRERCQVAEMKARLKQPLEEAEVMSNAFMLLTQAKLFTVMQATYNLTPAMHESIFGTFEIPYTQYDHAIPSDAPELERVPEGGEYTTGKLVDRYCKTKAWKYGKRVELTRETLIADKTGQVVQQAQGLASSAKYREDQLAALAFQDQSNKSLMPHTPEDSDAGCYWPEGTNVALYRTTAGSTKPTYQAVTNTVASNGLNHWNNITPALQLLKKMTNTVGQKIDVFAGAPIRLIVPIDIEQRARFLVAPGTGAEIRANLAAGTEYSITHVPQQIASMGVPQGIQVVMWNLLDGNGSSSTWYLAGNSPLQFRKHQVWAPEFMRATQAQLGGDDFRRDVLLAVRAGFFCGFRAVDDKYVIKNTA